MAQPEETIEVGRFGDYTSEHAVLSCGRDSPHQLGGPGDPDRAGSDRIPSLAAALDGRRGQTRTVWGWRQTFRRIGWTGRTRRTWELLGRPLNLGFVNPHIAEESPGERVERDAMDGYVSPVRFIFRKFLAVLRQRREHRNRARGR